MGLFDIGKLVDSVGDAVGNAAGAVAETADNAAKAVGDTVGGAASAVSDAAGGAAAAMAETAGGAASAATDAVGGAATAMIDTAGGAAATVGDAACGAAKVVADTAGGAATAAMDAAGGAVAAAGDAAGGAVSAVADMAVGAASVVADTAGGAATAVMDTAGGAATAVADTVGGAASAAVETAGNVVDAIETAVGLKEEAVVLQPQVGLTTRDALRLFYYEMSADGEVVDDELAKFAEICASFATDVPESDVYAIIDDCQEKLNALQGIADPLISAQTRIDELLNNPSVLEKGEEVCPPRLALWNMLAIAYCDGACADAERVLVNHVARIVEVEESVVLEMESFVLTLVDLEREETWVKTTNLPYLDIEATLKDIEVRKSAVFDGAADLIAL